MRGKLFQAFKAQLNELFFGISLVIELDSIKYNAENELKLLSNWLNIAVVFVYFACFASIKFLEQNLQIMSIDSFRFDAH